MMRNKKMGILAVLVMLVAVTLNAVGGTYAKYISAYSMTDEARVAKWDFRDEAVNTVDLFEASYSNENGVYVASSDASKVIAPGTEGEYKYDITGTAETNFMISKSTKIVNKVILATAQGAWNEGTLLYDPIEFDLGNGWVRLSELEGVEVAYDAKGNAQLVYELTTTSPAIYAANTVLKAGDIAGTIKWRWVFEADEENTYSNDVMDTKLGTDVVENEDLTITASIGVTVEQTQLAPTATAETKKTVTLSNKLNRVKEMAEENAAGFAAYGMNAADTEDVVFNGVKLTGTIRKNNSELANSMFGDMASGYYYALVVSEDAARVEFTGKVQGGYHYTKGELKTLGWNGVKAGEALMIGLYNDANAENNKFTITVKDDAGEVVQEITVDYSELNFAA